MNISKLVMVFRASLLLAVGFTTTQKPWPLAFDVIGDFVFGIDTSYHIVSIIQLNYEVFFRRVFFYYVNVAIFFFIYTKCMDNPVVESFSS